MGKKVVGKKNAADEDQTRFGESGRGWHVMFTAVGPRGVTRLGDMTACGVSGCMFY